MSTTSTSTENLLSTRLDTLPENLYKTLLAPETKKNTHSLTDLLQVPQEEKDLIENYLLFTLLMCLPIDLFSSTITQETSLTEVQAKNVLTQFLNSLPPDVQSDLKLISEDLLEEYTDSPEASIAIKKNSLTHLQQNFKTLREEALHTNTQEDTSMSVANTAPANLPTAQPSAADTTALSTPTIEIPHAVTKTSYTVEPMRTMASDVTRIHGYGAYRDLFPDEAGEQAHKEATIKAVPQEELLKERVVLAEKPNYNE